MFILFIPQNTAFSGRDTNISQTVFFKYQYGKQCVYETGINTPNNLKISLNNVTVLYLHVTQLFFTNLFNENAVLF